MATTSLSTLKADFYRHLGESWEGTATAGTTSLLTDSTLINLASDTYPLTGGIKGKQVRIESGSALGNIRQVAGFTPSTGAMAPNSPFSAAPGTASYILVGNTIHLGKPLTTLFNDTIRLLKPTKHTQVTIVTGQKRYDVSTLVSTRSGILRVYLRRLDSTGLKPYTEQTLRWDAEDVAGGGTALVYLWIDPQTLDTTSRELWVEHETTVVVTDVSLVTSAVFSADTDVVDASLRDWLAWSAVLNYAQLKLADVQADTKYWTPKIGLAASKLRALRPHALDPQPITIRAVS